MYSGSIAKWPDGLYTMGIPNLLIYVKDGIGHWYWTKRLKMVKVLTNQTSFFYVKLD